MAKNIRDIVKKNPTPARPRFGVDPSDPWSAKANIYEDGMLNKFLSSRGINPNFVSKDTKISHAKSSAYLKWKQEHTYEEVQLDEDKWLNRFLSSRGIDPKFVTTDRKVSFAKSGEFSKWLRDHKPDLSLRNEESEQIDEVSGMGIRSNRSHEPSQSDHDTVKKHLKNLMAIHSDEPTATSAVHRAIKKVSTAGTTSTKTRSREMLRALIQKHFIPIDHEHRALLNREQVENFDEAKKPTSLQKFRQASAERAKKHDDIEREMKARHAAGKEDMKGSIDRLEKQLNKEAIDTKDLISKLQKDLPKVNDPKNKDAKPVNWTGPKKDDYGYTGYQGHGMPTDKQERQGSKKIKEETGVSKSVETKFHKKLDKLVHSTFGKRKDEMKKEETEHKVGDSVTVNSKFFGKQKGKVTKIDNQSIHVQRNDKNTSEKYPHDAVVKEEVEQIDEVSKSEVDHHFHQWTNSEHAPYNSDAGDDNKVHQSALGYLKSTNVPKEKHEKLAMHIAHKFHGSGIDEEVEQIAEKNVPTSPEKWARAKAAAKSKFAVYPSAYANGWASKKYKAMGGGWKSVNEEVNITEKNDSHTHAAHYEDPKTGEWTGMNLLIAKDDDDAIRQANEKCKEGCRLTKVERHITVKEEVEQIDELKKSTVFSWLKQQPVVPEKKPGMSRKDHNKKIKSHSKSWNRALDRLAGYKPTSEDVYHDTQAATQMPFDGANSTNDTSPMKREMSKSARMIKSLYKSKNMKEDMYDWEKDDKSTKGYGKKPKMSMTDEKDSMGENKPEAAAIMTGGKTLTGQNRDTVEIDPSMKKRPGQPGTGAQDGSKTR
jgi:hypothetical protein